MEIAGTEEEKKKKKKKKKKKIDKAVDFGRTNWKGFWLQEIPNNS